MGVSIVGSFTGALAGLLWAAVVPEVQAGSPQYDRFSLPVTVSQLPPGSSSVPVNMSLNLSEALRRLDSRAAIDERSIRLYRVSPAGGIPETYQFIPTPQPRSAERRLLSGTSSSVSYLGEYSAGETSGDIQVSGSLTWMANADENGKAEYRLEFGCLRSGRAIQVPYPPQNLRTFDEEGRAVPVPWFPEMQIRPQWPIEGKLNVFDAKKPVTTYHIGPIVFGTSIRRPFLYPVNGPDGVSLTEFGKPHDPTGSHAHHYSLWIAHASVAGKDFWSEKGGIISHQEFESIEDGPLFCRIAQKARWVDSGNTILLDRRLLTVYREDTLRGTRLMDIDLEFTPPGPEPVVFGKTSFGFLAARVASSMSVFDGGGEILNANGDRNEQGAHLKRAAWIDQSGPVSREFWNGLAMMDHPENLNYPTGWHCRNDGWAGAAFNMENAFTLEPGRTLRLRYRVVLHRFDAKGGQVAERYREYASKPVFQIGPAVREISRP